LRVVDIRHLRCFVAVAEELHFGRAAGRLHVAGPAVSQTIRSLENELGLTLLHRTNRRVELTEAGQALLGDARDLLGRFDATLASMARLKASNAGAVRIAAVPALPPRLVPDLLSRCATAAPDIDVTVVASRGGPTAREALESDADIILLRNEVAEPGIESQVVMREAVGVALLATHALAAEARIEPRQLTGIPLISFPRASDPTEYDRIFRALAAAGLDDVRLVHESHPGAVEASLRLVAGGTGLSLKLESEVRAFAGDDVEWRPLAGVELEVVIYAAWRSGRTPPAVGRILSLVIGRA
jgi:DNA-binding transcriptional LysR family regulator